MSFVSDILGDVDDIRGTLDEFGLCTYVVQIVSRAWSGTAVGEGTATDTTTTITLVNGKRPKVRRVAYKETVTAGGKYQEGDYRIGPFTPDYVGGGMLFSVMAPTKDGKTEHYVVLTGPDAPSGVVCEPIAIEADKPLRRALVVRPTGATLGTAP